MVLGDPHIETDEPVIAVALLRAALGALAAEDWQALRSACHAEVVWHVPGRSPLAGDLLGVDMVIERFQRMRSATANDQRPELVSLLDGGDHAAVVQRNWILQPDGERRAFTAITLVRIQNNLVTEIWTLVTDQYATDALWERLWSSPLLDRSLAELDVDSEDRIQLPHSTRSGTPRLGINVRDAMPDRPPPGSPPHD